MIAYDHLAPFNDAGDLLVVVEAPRGSALKFEYSPELKAFTVARALPLGCSYPFDWGFVPGTTAPDGDPLDAMVIHPSVSPQGVVLTCRVLGKVSISERKDGKRISNDRIICTPTWHHALHGIEEIKQLPGQVRAELKQFFVAVTAFTDKAVEVRGWKGSRSAHRLIRSAVA